MVAEGRAQRLLASMISFRPLLYPATPVIDHGELIQIGVDLFFDHFHTYTIELVVQGLSKKSVGEGISRDVNASLSPFSPVSSSSTFNLLIDLAGSRSWPSRSRWIDYFFLWSGLAFKPSRGRRSHLLPSGYQVRWTPRLVSCWMDKGRRWFFGSKLG